MSKSLKPEKLYSLLPAYYRRCDADLEKPLKAFLDVIEEQVDIIDRDISGLYQNWFIETCDEWVVPYIGDLLGVKGIHPVSDSTYSLRAYVANTIAYRRRKGTATMLEQLANDITGWKARAVEFFQLLGTTQYINHLRLGNHRTPDLRIINSLELLATPLDTIAHTVDVRRIKSRRGKHNIPNIGIFLWRLQGYPLYRATARYHNDGKYCFNPLGIDMPLFNHPQTETEITHLAEEINLPGPIRRLALADDKESYYDKEGSIYLWVNGIEVPVENIIPCNLAEWQHRPPSTSPEKIAVDPVLGRIAFAVGVNPGIGKVEVTCFSGFSGDVGGGCYQRHCPTIPDDIKIYEIGRQETFDKTDDALLQWVNDGQKSAVLLIKDCRTYRMESLNINLLAGKSLEIRADDESFPTLKLKNPLNIVGGKGSKLILNGLRISGNSLIIEDGDLGNLEIIHCTLVPGHYFKKVAGASQPAYPNQPSLALVSGNTDLDVYIERSICGGIVLSDTHNLKINESIVQGLEIEAINGSNLTVEGSTIMGEVKVRQIELASNTIFTGIVEAELKQIGCVRFCFVPWGSRVPRRYRCQPDLVIKSELEEAKKIQNSLPETEKDRIINAILAWLEPAFTDIHYGTPGYAQLSLNCPREICEGAADGSEMGVFQHLMQPQRLTNLRTSLDEYLPANMEAGIFFVS